MEHHATFVLALIGLLGIAAQWLAWRLKLPAIVLLTVFGLVAGPMLGWVRPSEDLAPLLEPVVKVGVAVILFEGGLSLRFHELKQAGAGVVRLVTFGVALSFPLGSLAAHQIAGVSWPVALVFGAIIVVTGPTVIVPLLRQARLRRRPASYLKWEGILNDPVGALLAVVIFEYFVFVGEAPLAQVLPHVAVGLVVAGGLGVGSGLLLAAVYRRGHVPEYLKGPAALVVAIAVYVAANGVLGESGLLTATLLGITLGNRSLPSIDEIRRFKEYVALLLVSGVFILLTADLDPRILLALDWRSAALLAVVVFLVRPLAIGLATIGAGMSWQERALLAWIAPRGIVAAAVAAVFGPALAMRGYAGAELLLPLVFALILVTVTLHGLSIGWLARRLDLSASSTNGVLIVGASPWTVALAQTLKDREVPVLLVDSVWARLRAARLAGIQVFYGEILSEASEQRLEFNDYGFLIAATDNDAYNALVCNRFASEMGRNRVFQLPELSGDESDPKRMPRTVRGLIFGAEGARYEELLRGVYRGWTFQATPLSEEFGYDRLVASRPTDAVSVAAIRPDGAIALHSPEQPFKPKVGDVVVWFGEKPAPPNANSNASGAA